MHTAPQLGLNAPEVCFVFFFIVFFSFSFFFSTNGFLELILTKCGDASLSLKAAVSDVVTVIVISEPMRKYIWY